MPSDINDVLGSSSSTVTLTWTEPTASDNSGNVTLTSDYSPGDMFSVGTTTVTYTAADGYPNVVTDSFTITIQGILSSASQPVMFVMCYLNVHCISWCSGLVSTFSDIFKVFEGLISNKFTIFS